jgi:hypothetical protein
LPKYPRVTFALELMWAVDYDRSQRGVAVTLSIKARNRIAIGAAR